MGPFRRPGPFLPSGVLPMHSEASNCAAPSPDVMIPLGFRRSMGVLGGRLPTWWAGPGDTGSATQRWWANHRQNYNNTETVIRTETSADMKAHQKNTQPAVGEGSQQLSHTLTAHVDWPHAHQTDPISNEVESRSGCWQKAPKCGPAAPNASPPSDLASNPGSPLRVLSPSKISHWRTGKKF